MAGYLLLIFWECPPLYRFGKGIGLYFSSIAARYRGELRHTMVSAAIPPLNQVCAREETRL
jgi:hypothetical protein